MAMIVYTLDPTVRPETLGLLPGFLDEDDPRPAKEQFNERYVHGGGFHPIANFEMGRNMVLYYPGDPPYKPIAFMKLRNEKILFYRYAFVAIVQPNETFEVARLD